MLIRSVLILVWPNLTNNFVTKHFKIVFFRFHYLDVLPAKPLLITFNAALNNSQKASFCASIIAIIPSLFSCSTYLIAGMRSARFESSSTVTIATAELRRGLRAPLLRRSFRAARHCIRLSGDIDCPAALVKPMYRGQWVEKWPDLRNGVDGDWRQFGI